MCVNEFDVCKWHILSAIINFKANTVEPGYSDTGYSGKPGYSGKFSVT